MTPEILAAVNTQAKVLDLGSGHGSFPDGLCAGFVVRCDIEFQSGGGTRVCANAESLPFGPLAFDLVVSSHSLEHFSRPFAAIGEIGRVIKKSGGVFVAVPDGGSLSDRLYRWVASGGGHLNQFTDPVQLGREISDATGLRLNHFETLNSGFTFLNPRNCAGRPPGKLLLLTGGSETVLRFLTLFLRHADRILGARSSIYGWAFYLGSAAPLPSRTRSNVCIRCGSSHPSEWLLAAGAVRGSRWLRSYDCPVCGCRNFWTKDEAGSPSRVRDIGVEVRPAGETPSNPRSGH